MLSDIVEQDIVFDGTKRIFLKDNLRQKSQILINVLIIEHASFNCFEVITKYKDSIVRMYLNSKILKLMVDTESLKETFKIKCKIFEEQKHDFNTEEVIKDLETRNLVTMIKERLEISHEYKVYLLASATDKTIVHYNPLTDDCETLLEFELSGKPEGLNAYDVTGHSTFYPG